MCVVRVTCGSLLMVVTLNGAALVFALFGSFKDYLQRHASDEAPDTKTSGSKASSTCLNKRVMMPSASLQLAANVSTCKAAVDTQQQHLNILVSTTDLYLILYTIDLKELMRRIKQ